MALTRESLAARIDKALGRRPADLVIKHARILNLATGALEEGDVAVAGEIVVGTHESYDGRVTVDGRGVVVVPGFIDTHVHVESSVVTPAEFDRCVLPRGTTTAVCDPHEIVNVLGAEGLEYFLDSAGDLAMDLRVQLSSCVPSTSLETAGARLEAEDLLRYRDREPVIGLAEFMSFGDVFAHDGPTLDKLIAFEGAHIDGHAPLLSGYQLNAYAACGIHNCHESTNVAEAAEKLKKGFQVLIRDGSACKDVATLAPLLTDASAPFIAFCTDDRNPLDIAEEGHLDHVIRTAIAAGAPAAAAYRSATWSAAKGFGLNDRGLVAPGYLTRSEKESGWGFSTSGACSVPASAGPCRQGARQRANGILSGDQRRCSSHSSDVFPAPGAPWITRLTPRIPPERSVLRSSRVSFAMMSARPTNTSGLSRSPRSSNCRMPSMSGPLGLRRPMYAASSAASMLP